MYLYPAWILKAFKNYWTVCRYYFLCQRWLAKNKDDGQICRELVPVDKSVLKKLEREDSARMEVALETKGQFWCNQKG